MFLFTSAAVNKKKNVRFLITMPIELKEELQKEADQENRTLSNYIITLLKNRTPKK